MAFESETSVRLRSSATSFMLAFVKEGEEEEKERKAWPATRGTRCGDRRGIIAVSGAYASGSLVNSPANGNRTISKRVHRSPPMSTMRV